SKASEFSELDIDDLLNNLDDDNSNGGDELHVNGMNAVNEESDQLVHVNTGANANANANDDKDFNAAQNRTNIGHENWDMAMDEKQRQESNQRVMRRKPVSDKNEDGPFDIEEVELSQGDVSKSINGNQDNDDVNVDEEEVLMIIAEQQMKGIPTQTRTHSQQMQNQFKKQWKHLQTTITAYAKKHITEFEPIHKILSGEDGRWNQYLNVFDLFMCVWMTHRHELGHFAPSDRTEPVKHCYNALAALGKAFMQNCVLGERYRNMLWAMYDFDCKQKANEQNRIRDLRYKLFIEGKRFLLDRNIDITIKKPFLLLLQKTGWIAHEDWNATFIGCLKIELHRLEALLFKFYVTSLFAYQRQIHKLVQMPKNES
ncbi:hypothetical protein RFI_04000, partial [Reticulomyxa filosa]